MKKLLTVLCVFALIFSAYTLFSSQTPGWGTMQTKTCVSKVLPAGVTYYEYTPTATEYLGGHKNHGHGFDTLYFEVVTNKSVPLLCNARIEVSSRVGTADTYDMDVQVKLFANSTYAALTESAANTASKELTDTTRITAGGGSAISVRHILANKYWRYYRVICNTDNACATTDSLIISKVIFKFYEM
jgi:hypothetical protein